MSADAAEQIARLYELLTAQTASIVGLQRDVLEMQGARVASLALLHAVAATHPDLRALIESHHDYMNEVTDLARGKEGELAAMYASAMQLMQVDHEGLLGAMNRRQRQPPAPAAAPGASGGAGSTGAG